MKLRAAILGLTSVLAFSGPVTAQTYTLMPTTPDVYVVMFRADWCPPCKIVEPRLAEALQTLQDPKIEFVNIDISGGYADWNANAVFDRGIVGQYNMWMGITGFAAIIDGDTKKTLGCVNMSYDTQSMANHIRNLQVQARENRESFDLTCPEANNPV
jgi:thiol-disulfide isomerase/thioredoxin